MGEYYGMLPHWLFLPVFVSSNLQYNEAENVDVPLPIFYAQAPFQALAVADPLYSFSQLAPREHLFDEEPVHRGPMKRAGDQELQPLRFSGFKTTQQGDQTMQQVVRALRDILNERSQAVMKKADKMQYTRMGKRAVDKIKREGLEKMQYTRMGKRS